MFTQMKRWMAVGMPPSRGRRRIGWEHGRADRPAIGFVRLTDQTAAPAPADSSSATTLIYSASPADLPTSLLLMATALEKTGAMPPRSEPGFITIDPNATRPSVKG